MRAVKGRTLGLQCVCRDAVNRIGEVMSRKGTCGAVGVTLTAQRVPLSGEGSVCTVRAPHPPQIQGAGGRGGIARPLSSGGHAIRQCPWRGWGPGGAPARGEGVFLPPTFL